MKINIYQFLALTMIITLSFGCKKEPDNNGNSADFQNGVFVVCEGGFLVGNASVSYIHADGDTVSTEVFFHVNSLPLGDVAQSMVTRGDRAYIVVNNSAKIEVVDLADFTSIGTINDLGSPRYIHFISDTKAYVTDLFNSTIHIINPTTMTKTGSIDFNGWGEEMIALNDKVFVVAPDAGKVYRIDPNSDLIEDSIATGTQPFGLVSDVNDKLWTLASGGWQQDIPHLYRFDPNTMTIEQPYGFSSVDQNPSNLSINPAGTVLYFTNGDAYSMGIGESTIPNTAFIGASAATGSFYRMAVQPSTGDIFISDPIDFSQDGVVYRFDSSGSLLNTYDVGIAPGTFHFIGD